MCCHSWVVLIIFLKITCLSPSWHFCHVFHDILCHVFHDTLCHVFHDILCHDSRQLWLENDYCGHRISWQHSKTCHRQNGMMSCFSMVSTFSSNWTRVLLSSSFGGGIWHVNIMFSVVFCVLWTDALKYDEQLVLCEYEHRKMIKQRQIGEIIWIQENTGNTLFALHSARTIFSPQFLILWNSEIDVSIKRHGALKPLPPKPCSLSHSSFMKGKILIIFLEPTFQWNLRPLRAERHSGVDSALLWLANGLND